MVAGQGLEPRQTDPESVVLPIRRSGNGGQSWHVITRGFRLLANEKCCPRRSRGFNQRGTSDILGGMCRFLASSGDPILLRDVLYSPAHSLVRQSHEAHDEDDRLNADGFGV